MHLMTSPPSKPLTRHQHCIPLTVCPLPSSATCLPGQPTALPAHSVLLCSSRPVPVHWLLWNRSQSEVLLQYPRLWEDKT